MVDLYDLAFARAMGKGSGAFSTFELVNAIGMSLTTPDHYVYVNNKKDEATEKFEIFKNYGSTASLGIYINEFTDRWTNANCYIALNNMYVWRGDTDWHVKSSGQQYSYFYISRNNTIYNLTAFPNNHPALNDSDFLRIEEEISYPGSLSFPIGKAFNTGVLETDNVIFISTQGEGYHLVRIPDGETATFTKSGDTYTLNVPSTAKWTTLAYYLNINYTSKETFSYSSRWSTISGYTSVSENAFTTTFDIIDGDGNVLVHKNADVADYM